MKTAQEIAQVLLNRRNAMNPVVMQGEMLLALEAEGLQEALQRRWLVPQQDTGYLMVSQDAAKVQEMREVAEEAEQTAEALAAGGSPWGKGKASTYHPSNCGCKHCQLGKELGDPTQGTYTKSTHHGTADRLKGPAPEGKPVGVRMPLPQHESWDKPWEAPNESHDLALRHSGRNISELLSPATGHDTGSALRTPPPATPTTPPPAAKPDSRPPGIGDEVLVVSKGAGQTEGQTYTGKVTSNDSGQVKINFGNAERVFPENEVKVTKRAVPVAGATK